MLTGKLRNQVDRIWEAFWTGGITNPISVIEQFSYLLFIRRLDDIHSNSLFGLFPDAKVHAITQKIHWINQNAKAMNDEVVLDLAADDRPPY